MNAPAHALHYRQPVRRDSFDIADPRANVARPFEGGLALKDALLETFDEWDDQIKRKGQRHALGQNCRKVLATLLRCLDFKTGVCEPSLDTLMEKTRFARATVVRALKLLWANGFIDWIRRTERTNNPIGEGPQVRQVSNAYFFDFHRLPDRCFKRLREKLRRKGKRFEPPKAPNPTRFVGLRLRRAEHVRNQRLRTALNWEHMTPEERAQAIHPDDEIAQRAYVEMLGAASSDTGLNPPPSRSIHDE